MKINQWTLGLAAVGLVSLGSVAQAEEKSEHVLTALSSTTLSGYVDTSMIWRPGSGKDLTTMGRFNDPSSTHDGFNLHAVSLTLDKPLDEGSWSSGYHVQMIMGQDAVRRGTQTLLGGGAGGAGDFALHEAYVALRAPVGNGLDFKIGQFVTPIGYESFDSYKNPNFSRSYGFGIEPSTHVGVLSSYVLADFLSIQAGVANSYSAAADARAMTESKKTYMALVTFTAPESTGFLKGSTLTAGYINGEQGTAAGFGPVSGKAAEWIYLGGTLATPVAGLSLGFAYDHVENAVVNLAGATSHVAAYALYASFQATEKLKLNSRVEYATGTPGTLGYGVVPPFATVRDNELAALTLTADYALWQNVITRLEGRIDHDLNGQKPFGTSDKNAVTIALNVIYKF